MPSVTSQLSSQPLRRNALRQSCVRDHRALLTCGFVLVVLGLFLVSAGRVAFRVLGRKKLAGNRAGAREMARTRGRKVGRGIGRGWLRIMDL